MKSRTGASWCHPAVLVPEWGVVGTRAGLLALAAVCWAWLATRALRAYQRSA